jgi:hypothetical protein
MFVAVTRSDAAFQTLQAQVKFIVEHVAGANELRNEQHKPTMAQLAPHTCSPVAPRQATGIKLRTVPPRLPSRYQSCLWAVTRAAQNTAAATAPAWQVFTGKMPLVGFEEVAAALKHVQPAQQLLELHTYTLLQGPDQVGVHTPSCIIRSSIEWYANCHALLLIKLYAIAGTCDCGCCSQLQHSIPHHCHACCAVQVWYFDFLPLRPTHPATAALLLSASAAPGEATGSAQQLCTQ